MGRFPIPRTRIEKMRQMEEFEMKICKYYPKKLISFYNGSYYQRIRFDNFDDPKSLVAKRYKRSFFRSFSTNSVRESAQISHIPHNLRYGILYSGSELILKKLIKQNKRLESLALGFYCSKTAAMMIKYLRYSKSLRSIEFQKKLPLLSETECRKMLNTWGKRIEKINIEFYIKNSSVMNTLLQFPSLQDFKLRHSNVFFCVDSLQERQIAYSIYLALKNSNSLLSLLENQPKLELTDYVNIEKVYSSDPSTKMSLEREKIERSSKQKHFLRCKYPHITVEGSPKPIFRNIVSLDLTVSEDEWENSSIQKLDSLKHLSINISANGDKFEYSFEDFFAYLNQNVAPRKQLETFLMKATVGRQENQKNNNLAAPFFEACSATLKKVHLEFKYHDEEFDATECFYEGLSKLKNLQSLSLFLDFGSFKAHKAIETLCQRISQLKSLKELDLNIQKDKYQGKPLNLKFPPELKRLTLGMNTTGIPFDSSKAIWPVSNLTYLKLEFADFTSPKWSKMFEDITKRLKFLEVLLMKKTQETKSRNEASHMKEKLDGFMKESSSLKLVVFADMNSEEMLIFKRKNYLWSEINPIIEDILFIEGMDGIYTKSYP